MKNPTNVGFFVCGMMGIDLDDILWAILPFTPPSAAAFLQIPAGKMPRWEKSRIRRLEPEGFPVLGEE